MKMYISDFSQKKDKAIIYEQWHFVAYLDGLSERVNELRWLHTLMGTWAESQVELDALLPSPTGMISVLDRAFKGELKC